MRQDPSTCRLAAAAQGEGNSGRPTTLILSRADRRESKDTATSS